MEQPRLCGSPVHSLRSCREGLPQSFLTAIPVRNYLLPGPRPGLTVVGAGPSAPTGAHVWEASEPCGLSPWLTAACGPCSPALACLQALSLTKPAGSSAACLLSCLTVSKSPCEKLISKGSLSPGGSASLPPQSGSRDGLPALNTKILFPSECSPGPARLPGPPQRPACLGGVGGAGWALACQQLSLCLAWI